MSHPNKLVVIAAVLDTTQLTLYKEDGQTYPIMQGDPRITKILEVCQAGLKNLGDKVEVDLTEDNHYAAFEEKTGGLVKLFRVAKSKVKDFFKKTEAVHSKPITLGIVPTAKDVPAMTAVVTKKVQPLDAAIADIMQHATPVADKAFEEPKVERNADPKDESGDTMIAVVGGQIIPDVEALKPQMAASVLRPNATTVGMERFLARVAAVMGKRRHSVEDLMKFMAKGDLPIADDGSIVIYKILKRKEKGSDTFYDIHTGKVPQKVGSYVHMDEGLVDPNRSQDCSNGLHVASRSYLKNFPGDVVVLAKVAPEDVIAVPQYNTNKMRVCGYHILALLSTDTYNRLRADKPMTDNSTDQAILGRVLAGDHVGVQERVKITEAKGGGIEITQVGEARGAQLTEAPLAEALPENGHMAAPVDVKQVAKAVLAEKEAALPPANVMDVPPPAPAEAKPVKKISLKDQAAALMQHVLTAGIDGKPQAALQLLNLKKSSKKSWAQLGIIDAEGKALVNIAAPAQPVKGAIFTNEATIAKAEKKAVPKVRKERSDKGSKVAYREDAVKVSASPRERIRALIDNKKFSVTDAQSVLAIKKAAKKSWDALGVTPAEVVTIQRLASEQ